MTTAPTINYLSAGPTLRSIIDSWNSRAAGVGRERFPALGDVPLSDLDVVFEHTATATWRDAVLYSLLEASVAGDDLAIHTVVRLFIPRARMMARTCSALRGMARNDAQAITVSALWEAARTYPLRRTKSPAANLYLNALSIVSGGHVSPISEITVDDDYLEWKSGQADEITSPDQDLAEVFAWALESRILDRQEVAVMTRYYLADDTHVDRAHLALELGLTGAALQKRASRIRLRLIDAVKAHILAHGRW